MFWILNPHVNMMKPINKFFVQSKECPCSYMKQIFSFTLKMHCKRTLISTRGSQAAGRKQHWPRHGKLELSKKLHSTKEKKKSPTIERKQLQWKDACPHLLCCYLLISAKGKLGWVSWPRGSAAPPLGKDARAKKTLCIQLRWPGH